jgi:hypothetical protein
VQSKCALTKHFMRAIRVRPTVDCTLVLSVGGPTKNFIRSNLEMPHFTLTQEMSRGNLEMPLVATTNDMSRSSKKTRIGPSYDYASVTKNRNR